MVDHYADQAHRGWPVGNRENYENKTDHHVQVSRMLSRKSSERNRQHFNHIHFSPHEQLGKRPSNRLPPSLLFTTHKNHDTSYDTDGAIGDHSSRTRNHHHLTVKNYGHLVSPKLPLRRTITPLADMEAFESRRPRSSTKLPSNDTEDERDGLNSTDESRRRIRNTRLVQHSFKEDEDAVVVQSYPKGLPSSMVRLMGIGSTRTLRLIFLRHGERINQAFGPDWFKKSFSKGSYESFHPNLPKILPKRRHPEQFEYDVPLTVDGLRCARYLGEILLRQNLLPDLCLSSSALRCIQTCERVLKGMSLRDHLPIRVEPGLFECPHANEKIANSFMAVKELTDNGYNIKRDYNEIVPELNVPEGLEQYFQRCSTVMRGIIDRYTHHNANILIVTHAPGLMALPNAIQGIQFNPQDNFYKAVAKYRTLSLIIAVYDGNRWVVSDEPIDFLPDQR